MLRHGAAVLAVLIALQAAPAYSCECECDCDGNYYGYGGYVQSPPVVKHKAVSAAYRPAVYQESLNDDGSQNGGGFMVSPLFLLSVIVLFLMAVVAGLAAESAWTRYWKWRAEESERQKMSRGQASPKDFHFENVIR